MINSNLLNIKDYSDQISIVDTSAFIFADSRQLLIRVYNLIICRIGINALKSINYTVLTNIIQVPAEISNLKNSVRFATSFRKADSHGFFFLKNQKNTISTDELYCPSGEQMIMYGIWTI